MNTPDPVWSVSPERLLLGAVLGAAAVLAVFALLAIVRVWGLRMQRSGGSCGGLDLEKLKRQHLAGAVSDEEFEAVRQSIAGLGQTKSEGSKRPITKMTSGQMPDRSQTDEQV